MKMTRGKFEGMNACADEREVIAALAVDHRGNDSMMECVWRQRQH